MATPGKNNTSVLEIPFYELFEDLRRNGFAVEVTDYIEGTAIISKANIHDLKDAYALKYKLAPIVCRNADEQEAFYKKFDSFIDGLKVRLEEKARIASGVVSAELLSRKKRRTKLLAWLLPAIVFVFLAAWLYSISKGPYYYPFSYSRDQHIVRENQAGFHAVDTSVRNPEGFVKQMLGAGYDTAGIYAEWDFGDGSVPVKGLNPVHTYTDTGDYIVHSRFQTPEGDTIFADTVSVCDRTPELVIASGEHPVDEPFYLIKDLADSNKTLVWEIDPDTTITSEEDSIAYFFKEPGTYQVSSTYYGQACDHYYSVMVDVIEESRFSLSGYLPPFSLKTDISGTDLLNALLTVLIILIVALQFLRWWLKKIKKNKPAAKEGSRVNDVQPKGKRRFSELAFGNKNNLVQRDFFKKWSYQLLKSVYADRQYLHLGKSIRETIRNEDLFTPVYDTTKARRKFVFLIDAATTRSIQVNLFRFVSDTLIHFQVEVDYYFYDQSPAALYNLTSADISIRAIQDKHYQSVLVVWSNGFSFLDPDKAEINQVLKEAFSYWQNRVLITPEPFLDWSVNEKILSSFFYITPADIAGLSKVVSLLDKEILQLKVLGRDLSTYRSKLVLFEDIKELESYINDKQLFQCVCALAIYPKIRWEVVIHIFYAVAPRQLSYDNLLKIARIGWVDTGAFPDRLRLELLKKLEPDVELKAREAMIQLLEETPVAEGDRAAKEKEMQLIINKFILFTHDRVKYSAYHQQEKDFLDLYRQGKMMDIPLRVYLEKNDPDYPDKVKDKAHSTWTALFTTDLKSYAKETPQEIPENKLTFLTILSVFFSLIFVLLVSLHIVYPGNVLFKRWGLEKEIPVGPDKFNLILHKDSCYPVFAGDGNVQLRIYSDSNLILSAIPNSGRNGNQLPHTGQDNELTSTGQGGGNMDNDSSGNTNSASGTINFINDSANGIYAQFSGFESYFNKTLRFELENDNGDTISYTTIVNSDSVHLSVTGSNCVRIKDTVSIYYSAAQRKNAEALRTYLSTLNYYVDDTREFKLEGSNQVHYMGPDFSPAKIKQVEALQAIVSAFFNENFRTTDFKSSAFSRLPENDHLKIWIKNVKQVVDSINYKECTDYDGKNTYNLYYDSGLFHLRPEKKSLLNEIVSQLNDNPLATAELRGYIDLQPSHEDALKLTQSRVESIINYLVENGIDRTRLKGKSYGDVNPKFSNGFDNPKGRDCNRRVEIELIKTPDVPKPKMSTVVVHPEDYSNNQMRVLNDCFGYNNFLSVPVNAPGDAQENVIIYGAMGLDSAKLIAACLTDVFPGKVFNIKQGKINNSKGRAEIRVHNYTCETYDNRNTYTVYYEFDKWSIREEDKKVLEAVIDKLNSYPLLKAELRGYTDSKGSEDYQLALSQKQVQSIIDYFIAEGINADRLVGKGFGKTNLKFSDTFPDGSDNPEARACNRRTEIELIKKEPDKKEPLKQLTFKTLDEALKHPYPEEVWAVTVDGNEKMAFSSLGKFKNLSSLTIKGASPGDWSFLKPLGNLTSLVMQNQYVDAPLLADYLPNLSKLHITGSAIGKIDALGKIGSLKELSILKCNLKDIAFVNNLRQLNKLDLSGNQISNLKPLNGLISLRELNLSGNEISDISAVETLQNLIRLDLSENQISNIKSLYALKSLENLNLRQNKIENLDPVAGLKYLNYLNVANNYITDISPLFELKKIETFNFEGNDKIPKQQIEKLYKYYPHLEFNLQNPPKKTKD